MGTLTVREEKKPLSYCFRLKSFKIVTPWLALARPQSVSFLSFELTDLRLFARIWVVIIVQVGLKVKVRGEGQRSVQKCGQCTDIYLIFSCIDQDTKTVNSCHTVQCNKTTVQLFFVESQRQTKAFAFCRAKDDRLLLTVYLVYSPLIVMQL